MYWLDIKSSWNCRKAGETAFERTRLRSLGSKKAAAVRMDDGQEHVGTAAGECVPPPSLQSYTEVPRSVPGVNLVELGTCGLLLAGGGDEK